MRVIDAAWERPTPTEVTNAGYSGVIGYVSEDTTGKNITRGEIDRYHAASLVVGINYEYLRDAASQGGERGRRDAAIAVSEAQALGVPAGTCIYFSADWDVTDAQKPAVLEYITAADQYCAQFGYTSGLYGGFWICVYVQARGYKGKLWQTKAWSGGNLFANVALYQTDFDILVGSSKVDGNDVRTPEWGQWKGTGMEQGDQVVGTLSRGNKIGDVFADDTNFRDWWYALPPATSKNPPVAGSRADLLMQAVNKVISGDLGVTITQEMLNAAVAANAEAIGTAFAVEFAKHVKVQ